MDTLYRATSSAAQRPPAILGSLIQRIQDGTISGKIAKGLFESLWKKAIAGEAVDLIKELPAAGDIVAQIVRDAAELLTQPPHIEIS